MGVLAPRTNRHGRRTGRHGIRKRRHVGQAPAGMHAAGLALEAARMAYGLSMLRRHTTLDRLLGGRLLLQGAGTIWLGGEPAVHGTGGTVDALHAISMVGLAVGSRRWRRLGLRASLAAAGFAAAEAWCARSRS